jgi:undecaprenyl diphosphate synthase
MSSSPSPALIPGVPPEKMPRHIAMIMDGNGRWARQQGLPRIEGHRKGAASVRTITEECARLGIEQLTLYCFSSENWKRSPEEIGFLMQLLERYLVTERERIMRHNIRLSVIGRREGLPEAALAELEHTMTLSRGNSGLRLCLAINYGSRGELVDAFRSLAAEVLQGRLRPEDICETTIQSHLYTAGMSDPDLLIRTAGEMRLSNFLLWQISYAELWVTECCWPDFGPAELAAAIRSYAARERRFGGLE